MSDATAHRALIIHGYGATPRDHWFPWLAETLTASGLPATVVGLPDPETPDPAAWQAALAEEIRSAGPPTTVVAHSLGCLTLLRRLSDAPWPLQRLVLVAGFADRLPALPELDEFIDTTVAGVDLATLRAHVASITVVRSDNDAVVPAPHTDRLAAMLDTEPMVIPGAGHFLADEGFSRLEVVSDALGTARAS